MYKPVEEKIHFLTSTFPLLAHRKQRTLGVTGTEVSRLRPPASHTFSTSWSLLKSTLIRCTPSQGALGFIRPLVEGVLSKFKVLLLGALTVRGCMGDRERQRRRGGVSVSHYTWLTQPELKSLRLHSDLAAPERLVCSVDIIDSATDTTALHS